jgi:hypothetical protein
MKSNWNISKKSGSRGQIAEIDPPRKHFSPLGLSVAPTYPSSKIIMNSNDCGWKAAIKKQSHFCP